MPIGCAGDARQLEVLVLVTARALHTHDALVVRAANDWRVVDAQVHALVRRVAVGMAVHAARMQEHPAGLEEERAGSCYAVSHLREGVRAAKRATGGLRRGGASFGCGFGLPPGAAEGEGEDDDDENRRCARFAHTEASLWGRTGCEWRAAENLG